MFRRGLVTGICLLLLQLDQNCIESCVPVLADEIQYPVAVARGGQGEIFVADRKLPGIWKLDKGEKKVFFRSLGLFRSPLNAVRCLAIDSEGVLYAGDTASREIYRLDAVGSAVPLTGGRVKLPTGIVIDSAGRMLVADMDQDVVFSLSTDGILTEFFRTPAPRAIALDSGDNLWVLSHEGDAVIRYSPQGETVVIVPGSPFQFSNQLIVDENGVVFVSDGQARSIWKISPDSVPLKLYEGEPLKNPVGIAFDGDCLLITDPVQRGLFTAPIDGSRPPELLVR